jgi:hypothetical protein
MQKPRLVGPCCAVLTLFSLTFRFAMSDAKRATDPSILMHLEHLRQSGDETTDE